MLKSVTRYFPSGGSDVLHVKSGWDSLVGIYATGAGGGVVLSVDGESYAGAFAAGGWLSDSVIAAFQIATGNSIFIPLDFPVSDDQVITVATSGAVAYVISLYFKLKQVE